jgi:UDP-glucose 6-dehydrogenase
VIRCAVIGMGRGADLLRQTAGTRKVFESVLAEDAQVIWLAEEIDSLRPYTIPEVALHHHTELIVSSPVPMGTTDKFPDDHAFSYVLENVRENDRLIDFPRPPFVRGRQARNSHPSPLTDELLKRVYGGPFYETSAREAEFIKHALNALLATCVAFSEEIRDLAGGLGHNAEAVARCLRQDPRIGSNLPILPRGRYSSHLQRDVRGLLVNSLGLGDLALLKAVLRYRQGPNP